MRDKKRYMEIGFSGECTDDGAQHANILDQIEQENCAGTPRPVYVGPYPTAGKIVRSHAFHGPASISGVSANDARKPISEFSRSERIKRRSSKISAHTASVAAMTRA